MNIYKDAIKVFGKKKVETIISLAGHHANTYSIGEPKKTGRNMNEKIAFALMEICDFQCYNFQNSNCNPNISENKIKKFLKKHKKFVLNANIDPPSYLGLLSGSFDFLKDALHAP